MGTEIDSGRLEINRLGAENAGLRERLDILHRRREDDLAVHRDEVSNFRKEITALQSKMDELRVLNDTRVQDAQGRVEAALRAQATLADGHRRELAEILEKSRLTMALKTS